MLSPRPGHGCEYSHLFTELVLVPLYSRPQGDGYVALPAASKYIGEEDEAPDVACAFCSRCKRSEVVTGKCTT